MRWIQQYFGIIIMVLVIAGPAIGRVIQGLAEKRRNAAARRNSRSSPTSETTFDRNLRERKQQTLQTRDERAAQRQQAKIEQWRQRQEAFGQPQPQSRPQAPQASMPSGPSNPSAEIARRRQQAIEALRQRQAQARQPQARVHPRPAPQGTRQGSMTPPRPGPRSTPRPTHRPTPAIPTAQPPRQARVSAPKPRVQQPPTARQPQRASQPFAHSGGTLLPMGPNGLRLNRAALRQAFALKEIFDAPVALRQGHFS